MPEYRFDHVHIVSPDPLKTAGFYEKTFNAKRGPTNQLPGGRISVDIDLAGAPIKIMSPRTKPLSEEVSPEGIEHLALTTNNIDATVAGLKAQGVKFLQDVAVMPSGRRACFFLTPENVLFELTEVKR